jgi:hypothetical protein
MGANLVALHASADEVAWAGPWALLHTVMAAIANPAAIADWSVPRVRSASTPLAATVRNAPMLSAGGGMRLVDQVEPCGSRRRYRVSRSFAGAAVADVQGQQSEYVADAALPARGLR